MHNLWNRIRVHQLEGYNKMGVNAAIAYAEMSLEGDAQYHAAMQAHLSSNFYPPLPTEFAPLAMSAISKCVDDNPDAMIELPDGMKFHGEDIAPAREVISFMHLNPFVELRRGIDLVA